MRRAAWLMAVSMAAVGCNDPAPMDLQPLPAFQKVPSRPDALAKVPPEQRGPQLVPTDEVLDGGVVAVVVAPTPDSAPPKFTEAQVVAWAKMIDEFSASPAVVKLGRLSAYGLGQDAHMILLTAPFQDAWKKAQQHAGLDDEQVVRLNALASSFTMTSGLARPSTLITSAQVKDKNNVAAMQAKAGVLDSTEVPKYEALRSTFGDSAVDAVLKHADQVRAAENKRGAYQSWARLQASTPVVLPGGRIPMSAMPVFPTQGLPARK